MFVVVIDGAGVVSLGYNVVRLIVAKCSGKCERLRDRQTDRHTHTHTQR